MKIVDYLMIGATIRIGQEILCLRYAGFLTATLKRGSNLNNYIIIALLLL